MYQMMNMLVSGGNGNMLEEVYLGGNLDPEHIYALITQYDELSTAAEKLIALNQDTLIPALQQTLEYYISEAQLSDSQQKILQLKRANYKNSDIAAIVNKQFHKTYTPNYISTIYRKKILPAIADAATYHKNVIWNT